MVAVLAVCSERLSRVEFPVKRENTGNFRRSGLKIAIGLAFRTGKSESCGQIPLRIGAGNFSELIGNLTRISGNGGRKHRSQ